MKELPAGRLLGKVGALMVSDSSSSHNEMPGRSKMPKIPYRRGKYYMTVDGESLVREKRMYVLVPANSESLPLHIYEISTVHSAIRE